MARPYALSSKPPCTHMGSSGHQPPSIQIVPSPTTVAGPGSDAFPLSARAGEPPNTDAAAAGDVDSAAHKRPAGQPLMPLAIPNGFVPALGPLGRPEHLPPLVLGPSSSYLRSPTFPSGGSSPPVSTASEPVNAFRFHARPSSDGESSPSSNTESPNTASSHNSTMQRHRSLTLLSSPSSSSSSLMVQNNVERAVSLTSMTPSISQPAKHIPPGPESPSVPSPDGVQDLTMMGKYLVQRTVGVGTFSKVKLGEDTETGQPVAIKVVPLKSVTPLNVTHIRCVDLMILLLSLILTPIGLSGSFLRRQ